MAQIPTGPHPIQTAVNSFRSRALRSLRKRLAAKYPVGKISAINTSISSGMSRGVSTKVLSASGQRTYSACPPSMVLAGTELPKSSPCVAKEVQCSTQGKSWGGGGGGWGEMKRGDEATYLDAPGRLPAHAVVTLAACGVEGHDDLVSSIPSARPIASSYDHTGFDPTLSPILNFFTSSPTATISPTNSCPRINLFRSPTQPPRPSGHVREGGVHHTYSGGHLRWPR